MIRSALAVAAGLLTGVAGMRHARCLRQAAGQLRRWEALLARLALLLSEAAYTLPEALRQAAQQASAPDEWLRALADELVSAHGEEPAMPVLPCPLPAPEAEVMARLLPRLTHGSLAARVQAVSQAQGEMASLAQAAEEVARRDARMWSQLGWLAGACLTILLL